MFLLKHSEPSASHSITSNWVTDHTYHNMFNKNENFGILQELPK